MKNISITVENKRATVVGSPVIICGNSDYTVTFTFDNEWSLTGVRTARFVYVKRGEVMHEDVVFEGDTVAVPVLSDVTCVNVGVFAGDLCTTTPARVNCHQSILCGSGEAHEPTPDVYDQIMALFNEMAEKGAFGATEEQAQQIAQNQADIEALADGTKKAGDAEKLGGRLPSYYATAESVANLEDGTTPAGDANKLGGHGAEYFAKSGFGLGESANIVDSWDEATLPGFYVSKGNSPTTDYSHGVVFSNSEALITQLASPRPHVSNEILSVVYFRTRNNSGTWSTWKEIATTEDLANYLPLTGGTVNGDFAIANTAEAKRLTFRLQNNLRQIISRVYEDGSYKLYDMKNSKNIIDSTADGTNTFNGTASGNLLLNGGGTVKKANAIPVMLDNTSSGADACYLAFLAEGAVQGTIGVRYGKPVCVEQGQSDAKIIHHDGNSAKVHIGTSAPSDTSSVWFDTSDV